VTDHSYLGVLPVRAALFPGPYLHGILLLSPLTRAIRHVTLYQRCITLHNHRGQMCDTNSCDPFDSQTQAVRASDDPKTTEGVQPLTGGQKPARHENHLAGPGNSTCASPLDNQLR